MALHLAGDGRCTRTVAAIAEQGQSHQEVGVIVGHVLCMEAVGIVLGDEAGVELARDKVRVRQQGRLERDVGADAADGKAVERFTGLGDGVVAILPCTMSLAIIES